MSSLIIFSLSPSPPPCNLSTPAPLHSCDGAAVAAATISVAGADSLLRSVQLSYTTSGGDSNRQKCGAVLRLTPASHTSKSPAKKSARTTLRGAPLRRTRGGYVSLFDPVADGPSPLSVVPPLTDARTTRRRTETTTTTAKACQCPPNPALTAQPRANRTTAPATGASSKQKSNSFAPKNAVKAHRNAVINSYIFKWSRPHIFGIQKELISDDAFL